MKRILMVVVTILLAAVVVVVSMLGSSPRTVHMAALAAMEEGNFEMAVSHLKRSDHPDAQLLLSQMYYVPKNVEVVESTPEGDLLSSENYVYNLAGQLYKHESTAVDGSMTIRTNTYDDFGNLLLAKTEWKTPILEEEEGLFGDGEEAEETEEGETSEEDLFSGSQVEYFYDTLGRLLCKRTTDSTGLFYQYRYTHDTAGRVIAEVYVDGDANWSRREYTYDGGGRKLTERYTDYAGEWKNTTYTYADDVLRTETVEDADGVSKTVYNKDGNWLSRTVTPKGGKAQVTKFTYDGSGNLLTRTHPDGRRDVYVYNEAGLLTDSELESADGIVTVTAYTYDEDGRMLTRVIKVGDADESKDTYTYNKDGKLIKTENVTAKGAVTTTEYTYERYGNPETVVKTAADGTVTTTIEWKVRYYPTGMPDNVREAYELYDVDKPVEQK